ncbi:MAG: response regulator [Campylobacterales bacterium]|nr:response regulator [Campylobacterales bacterium]
MLNVVVVDDSLIMRRSISRIVIELGHKVVAEAINGLGAIRCCEDYTPDLITMDITMPDMDGITAVKEIRKINKYVKIIMITSHGQENMVKDAIRSGASGYLLKPIAEDKFFQTLDKVFPEMKILREKMEVILDSKEDSDLTIDDD